MSDTSQTYSARYEELTGLTGGFLNYLNTQGVEVSEFSQPQADVLVDILGLSSDLSRPSNTAIIFSNDMDLGDWVAQEFGLSKSQRIHDDLILNLDGLEKGPAMGLWASDSRFGAGAEYSLKSVGVVDTGIPGFLKEYVNAYGFDILNAASNPTLVDIAPEPQMKNPKMDRGKSLADATTRIIERGIEASDRTKTYEARLFSYQQDGQFHNGVKVFNYKNVSNWWETQQRWQWVEVKKPEAFRVLNESRGHKR